MDERLGEEDLAGRRVGDHEVLLEAVDDHGRRVREDGFVRSVLDSCVDDAFG